MPTPDECYTLIHGQASSMEGILLGHRWIFSNLAEQKLEARKGEDAIISVLRITVTTAATVILNAEVKDGILPSEFESKATIPLRDAVLSWIQKEGTQWWANFESYESILQQSNDGFLPDLRFADSVKRIGGEESKSYAKALRNKSLERWKAQKDLAILWIVPEGERPNFAPWIVSDEHPTNLPPWIRGLTQALWTDVVRPKLEKERKRQPAVVTPILREVAELHSNRCEIIDSKGQLSLQLTSTGNVTIDLQKDLPSIDIATLGLMTNQTTNALASIHAQHLFRWQIRSAHKLWNDGSPDFRRLTILGGWSGLAEQLGIKNKGAIRTLQAVVKAQAHARFTSPDGRTGNLISYTEPSTTGRGRGTDLTMVIGDMLCPGYVYILGENVGEKASRHLRKLAPITDLPPLVGRPNEHGAQGSLSALVVTKMREQAVELVEFGGIHLDLSDFACLARVVGLSKGIVPKVVARWIHDGDDGPSFLKQVDRDRYTLGDAHSQAREFIEVAGRKELSGAENGRKQTAKRNRRLGL